MVPSVHIQSETGFDTIGASLFIIAGAKHISFGILNEEIKTWMEYGYYVSDNDEHECTVFIENFDPFKKDYRQIVIAFDSVESLFVPSVHFENDNAKEHLDLVYGTGMEVKLMSEDIQKWNMFNIYRVPDILYRIVNRKFNASRCLHLYSVLLRNYSSPASDSILVDFKTEEFTVAVFRNNYLELMQTFSYSTPEDVLYYLLRMCNQFSLSQEQIRIILSGLIEKDSAVFRELYKYFIFLEFESLPREFKLDEKLHEYPEHFFSSISKLAACVS